MNTLLKTIAVCTLILSATAQSPTECSPASLPTFCPAVYNSCCKYLCSGGGQPACWDRNITDTGKSPAGVRGVTCDLCPTGLAYIPLDSTSSEEPPAAAPTTEQVREVTTKGSTPVYTPGAPEGTGNSTTPISEPAPTGNVSEPSRPDPTYISGASSVLAMSGTAILGVFCFMMIL
ncbi:hypothetical protein TWF751_009431 [Orbilia oligospora]|nr:hypothetical protein TWF751_009431 [Orbilia oligospora]